MKTEGVIRYDIPKEGVLVVTFDDGKTDVPRITERLEKANFPVQGKPVYLKPSPPIEKRFN